MRTRLGYIETRQATLEEKARWQAKDILRHAARESGHKSAHRAWHYVNNPAYYKRMVEAEQTRLRAQAVAV